MNLISWFNSLHKMQYNLSKTVKPILSSPLYENRHSGKTFLVLGNGPSLNDYKREIYSLIDKHEPIVMGANNITNFIYPTYHAFTNRKRFIAYARTIDPDKSHVLLSPYLPPWLIRKHYQGDYEEIMYNADNEKRFDIQNGIIQASCRTVSVLLIGVAFVMGAKKILVAGLDGYGKFLAEKNYIHFYKKEVDLGDVVEVEKYCMRFLREIAEFMTIRGYPEFKIVTPTSYEKHYENIQKFI